MSGQPIPADPDTSVPELAPEPHDRPRIEDMPRTPQDDPLPFPYPKDVPDPPRPRSIHTPGGAEVPSVDTDDVPTEDEGGERVEGEGGANDDRGVEDEATLLT